MAASKLGAGAEAVQLRHRDVEQDEGRVQAFEHLQRLAAVLGLGQRVARGLEGVARQVSDEPVVVGDQDQQFLRVGAGVHHPTHRPVAPRTLRHAYAASRT